ncbi:MAG: MATE family efflux transporter [Actinomycetaceae bacterium]|nr:MATE family efflux transporter [Actinomycetaceae bacterium]
MTSPPNLTRRILALAIPALATLITEPLFTLIDSAMVGHLGTAQLAGLSVASQVLATVVVLFIFLAYSTTSLAAQALGRGDQPGALRVGIDAMWLAAGLGALAAVGMAAGAPFLPELLGASGEVADHARAYLWACAPGLVGMLVVLAGVGTFRGLQDTRTPLWIATGGMIFNVAANALFIYGFGMGVAGSGLGTTCAQLAMAAIVCALVGRSARQLGVGLRPSGSGILTAAGQGAPLIVRGLALRIAGLATLWPVARLGADAVAAYQVVLVMWMLAAFILDALAIAAQSMVGMAQGAGDKGELRALLRVLTQWGLWAGVAVGVVIAALSPWVPLAFGGNPTMWGLATVALLACCVGMPLGGVVFLLDGVLLGAGDNRYFAWAGIVQLAVYLPALALLEVARSAGASDVAIVAGVWLVYSLVYMVARTVSNVWRTWFSAAALVPREEKV